MYMYICIHVFSDTIDIVSYENVYIRIHRIDSIRFESSTKKKMVFLVKI